MISTLFLSGYVTALADRDEDFRRLPGVTNRKGGLRTDAGEVFDRLEGQGDAVVCLPPSATSCQILAAEAPIGRRLTHTDLSDALEAALVHAGGGDQVAVYVEPSAIKVDGVIKDDLPLGQAADRLQVEFTALLSPLSFLRTLEKRLNSAGLHLQGVIGCEEAAGAALRPDTEDGTYLLFDKWRTKIIRFQNRQPVRSATVPLGPGHIADDIAVTLDLDERRGEDLARRILLGRARHDEKPLLKVVEARLGELVSAVANAANLAGLDLRGSRLAGLPAASDWLRGLAELGVKVEDQRPIWQRSDPAIFALAEGARQLVGGATERSAASAFQLESQLATTGPLQWLRRNF
ncbi:MAG: hypothetical protein AAGG79_01630 [Pseudomonadota bacterium]